MISSHILTELSDFCNTIGIIEKGALRTFGEIETIKNELKLNRVIEVEVREDAEKAHDALQEREEVMAIRLDGNKLEVEVELDLEDTSFVLETLMAAGCRVVSVQERDLDLEDIFMEITKGEVH